jgi:hypothetical protein
MKRGPLTQLRAAKDGIRPPSHRLINMKLLRVIAFVTRLPKAAGHRSGKSKCRNQLLRIFPIHKANVRRNL